MTDKELKPMPVPCMEFRCKRCGETSLLGLPAYEFKHEFSCGKCSGTEHYVTPKYEPFRKFLINQAGGERPTPNTDQVVEQLKAIRELLSNAPPDCLGCVPDTPDCQGWHVRDEVIHNITKALATTQPSEKERRHKPCGAEYCCYTDDRELVECLEANLKKEEAENKVLREDLKTAINIAAAPDDEWDGKHDALLSDCAKHLKPRGE